MRVQRSDLPLSPLPQLLDGSDRGVAPALVMDPSSDLAAAIFKAPSFVGTASPRVNVYLEEFHFVGGKFAPPREFLDYLAIVGCRIR